MLTPHFHLVYVDSPPKNPHQDFVKLHEAPPCILNIGQNLAWVSHPGMTTLRTSRYASTTQDRLLSLGRSTQTELSSPSSSRGGQANVGIWVQGSGRPPALTLNSVINYGAGISTGRMPVAQKCRSGRNRSPAHIDNGPSVLDPAPSLRRVATRGGRHGLRTATQGQTSRKTTRSNHSGSHNGSFLDPERNEIACTFHHPQRGYAPIHRVLVLHDGGASAQETWAPPRKVQ